MLEPVDGVVPLPAFVLISRLPEFRWVFRTGSEADQDEALDEVRTESGEHRRRKAAVGEPEHRRPLNAGRPEVRRPALFVKK